MKLSILCENTSQHVGCLAEWGFSCFIELEATSVLFDTGYSEVYRHNAQEREILLDEVDYVVLSHFHSDHTRGLHFHPFTTKKPLICHPEVLEKLPKSEVEKIKRDFELMLSTQPLEFSKDLFYLGEIPRQTPFEKGGLPDDPMRDDSALVVKTGRGAIVISGCSHAGICNICEYAKQITQQQLYAVIGGFHLFQEDQATIEATLNYFEREKPTHLLPMHCVDFPTQAKFLSAFGCKKYGAGDVIEL